MTIHTYMTHRQSIRNLRSAFTLVEILIVLFLVGIVALPFTRMFSFGIQGSNETLEHIFAYNLAREKIEEVRSLPFELVISDFENFRGVYRDRGNDFAEACSSKEGFEKIFSDIVTNERLKIDPDRETCLRIQTYYKKAFRRECEIYPDEAGSFRRVMEVDDKFDTAVPPRLKKVSVRIYDKHSHRIAEVVTLVGLHQ
ncbi:MAG: type II secretion system protein [Candidatus Riflebacteria bacterium]|nr:type II secretion system protein [Candidatus Riflebacteria bacterium]